jgi:putative transcriptional regulator
MSQAAPCLLVASPLLLDPNFMHTVVLMVEHNDGGAMGIVLNRPLPFPVDQVCMEGNMEYNGSPGANAYYGGPVEPGRGTLLVRGEMPGPSDTVLNFTDFVSFRRDLLESVAKNPNAKYRLFLGYSGWGAGQLEKELEQHAWIRVSLEPELLFLEDTAQMWRTTIKTLMSQVGDSE